MLFTRFVVFGVLVGTCAAGPIARSGDVLVLETTSAPVANHQLHARQPDDDDDPFGPISFTPITPTWLLSSTAASDPVSSLTSTPSSTPAETTPVAPSSTDEASTSDADLYPVVVMPSSDASAADTTASSSTLPITSSTTPIERPKGSTASAVASTSSSFAASSTPLSIAQSTSTPVSVASETPASSSVPACKHYCVFCLRYKYPVQTFGHKFSHCRLEWLGRDPYLITEYLFNANLFIATLYCVYFPLGSGSSIAASTTPAGQSSSLTAGFVGPIADTTGESSLPTTVSTNTPSTADSVTPELPRSTSNAPVVAVSSSATSIPSETTQPTPSTSIAPQSTRAIQSTPTPEPQNTSSEPDSAPDVEIITEPVIVYISSGHSEPFSTTTVIAEETPSESATIVPGTTSAVTVQSSELPSLAGAVSSPDSSAMPSEEPEETVTIHAIRTKSVTMTMPGKTVTVISPTPDTTSTPEVAMPTVSSSLAVTATPEPQAQPKNGGTVGGGRGGSE
ncbi:hypothetical protein N7492_004738 [Penicillium capsulatum]|uniref:Uncharacterized protein n=1 Tax=Penicillium capsulatum TaxID=69766 RepID=A0A9W9IB11_9EURO|nr:hypothetical protein N7492_004738 [Penicillium capsulatum]